MDRCEKRWTDVKMDRTGYATRHQHPRGHSSSCLISSCDCSTNAELQNITVEIFPCDKCLSMPSLQCNSLSIPSLQCTSLHATLCNQMDEIQILSGHIYHISFDFDVQVSTMKQNVCTCSLLDHFGDILHISGNLV